MTKKSKKPRQAPRSETAPPQQQNFLGKIALPALIILVALIAYGNSLHGQFVLDDQRNFEAGDPIHSILPTRSGMLGPPWTTFTGRPITLMSFAIGYRIHGLEPFGYHLINLIIHLCAALILYGVLRRTLLLPSLQPRFKIRENLLAGIVALIWACHPLNTASVTYISQRSESLMGMFYLLTVYCFIRGATGKAIWYWGSIISCLLGLFAKEPMVSAPLFIWLYDRTLLSDSFSQALRRRRWAYIGLASTWVPFAILLSMHPHGPEVSFGFPELSSFDNLKTQAKVIVHYLKLCFWPSPLLLYYGTVNKDIHILRNFSEYAPWGIIVVILLGLTAFAILRRRPIALFGAWFFLILAPSSSIVAMPTEMIAEYRMYLPLIAVIGISVFIADMLIQRRALTILAAILVVALTLTTRRRNEDFATPLALWQDMVSKSPDNNRALTNLGMFEFLAGRNDQAEKRFQRAVDLDPTSTYGRAGLGMILETENHLPEAEGQFRLACKYGPLAPECHLNLAIVLALQNRYQEAIDVLLPAVKRISWDHDLPIVLGAILVKSGRDAEGRAYLDQTIAREFDRAEASHRAGHLLLQLKALDAAQHYFEQSASLSSHNPDSYLTLGVLLTRQGQMTAAMVQYRRVLSLAPDNTIALNNLAWYLATSPDASQRDGNLAVQYAQRAIGISGRRDASSLDTLAAAYAETGKFDQAIALADEAVHKAEQNPGDANADEIRQRLVLYRSGRPFHDQAISSTAPGMLPPTIP